MKAVETIVQKVSGKKPSKEIHPDEAVAMGAAIQADWLKRKRELVILQVIYLQLSYRMLIHIVWVLLHMIRI